MLNNNYIFFFCRLFRAGRVYGCANDAQRFGFFCRAALEYLLQDGFHPVRCIGLSFL